MARFLISMVLSFALITPAMVVHAGDKLPFGAVVKEFDRNTMTVDGYAVSYGFPPGSTDIEYLGRGWFSFILAEDCFILRHDSLSRASVCKYTLNHDLDN